MSKIEHLQQDSEDSELKALVQRKDVWEPLGPYAKIDVFKFLRPYDIRKFCVFVNKNWLNFCVDNQRLLPRPLFSIHRSIEEVC